MNIKAHCGQCPEDILPTIDAIIAYFKQNGNQEITGEMLDKMMTEAGVDSAFVFDFWPNIKTSLEKEGFIVNALLTNNFQRRGIMNGKIDELVILADSLDERGHVVEAQELDNIIQQLVSAPKEEEKVAKEEKERQTSKKVMKVFKRLREAAEKVCDTNVDTRGPYRDLFDKARFGAQEICALLKDIEFTPEGEKEAEEEGVIQQNLADVEQGVAAAPPYENVPAAPIETEVPVEGEPQVVAV